MHIKDGNAIFSDGSMLRANGGIFGIDAEGGLFDGYDSQIWYLDQPRGDPLSNKHIIELCEHMIARWSAKLEQARAAAESDVPQSPPEKAPEVELSRISDDAGGQLGSDSFEWARPGGGQDGPESVKIVSCTFNLGLHLETGVHIVLHPDGSWEMRAPFGKPLPGGRVMIFGPGTRLVGWVIRPSEQPIGNAHTVFDHFMEKRNSEQ